jgi:hypothetical protein
VVAAEAQALTLHPLALVELSRRLETHLADAVHLKIFHLAEVEITRGVTFGDELALGETAISPVTLELLAGLVGEPTEAMMLPGTVEVSLEDGPIVLFLDDLICLEVIILDIERVFEIFDSIARIARQAKAEGVRGLWDLALRVITWLSRKSGLFLLLELIL